MNCWRLLWDKSLINTHQMAPHHYSRAQFQKEAARKYRQTNSLYTLLALRLFYCCHFSLTLKPTWLKSAKLKLAKGNRPHPSLTTTDPHQQSAEKNGASGNKSLRRRAQRDEGGREDWRGQSIVGKMFIFLCQDKRESMGDIDVSL